VTKRTHLIEIHRHLVTICQISRVFVQSKVEKQGQAVDDASIFPEQCQNWGLDRYDESAKLRETRLAAQRRVAQSRLGQLSGRAVGLLDAQKKMV